MSFEIMGRWLDSGVDKIAQPMPWWGTVIALLGVFFIARFIMEFIPRGVNKDDY